MPNWKIPKDVRDHIKHEATKFADRPLLYALSGFLMTAAEVQLYASALTREQVFQLRELSEQGVRTIERNHNVRVAFFRRNFPGLRRSVVLNLQLPEYVVLGRATYMGMGTTKYKDDEPHYIPCDPTAMSVEDKSQITEYLNTVIRHQRLYEITNNIVEAILERELTPTTSHLHALWPLLCTLHDDGYIWRERFRNPTRTLKAYQPHSDILSFYKPYMEACETAILAGQLIDQEFRWQRGKIRVSVETWERLPGDVTFPLENAPELPKGS